MQVFADDGATLDVRVDGSSGDAVVLIHGFPLSRDVWNAQSEVLSKTHRTIRPNLRGVGKSSATPGPYLMEALAADVATALDALGVERATIVGNSLGGYVALAFVRMFSERVERLALVCSRLAADTPEQSQHRRELADRIEREKSMSGVIDAYLPRLFAPSAYTERAGLVQDARDIARGLDATAAAATLRGMALRDAAFDIAPDVGVPVLVVAGGQDAIVGTSEAQSVARAFPRGRLAVCPRSGHLPQLEEPGLVTEALLGLLAGPV
jgi:3-oxoadipate enol-lactonase